MLIERILDFRPSDYVTVKHQIGDPNEEPLLISYVMREIEGGTRLEARFGQPSAAGRVHFENLRPVLEASYPKAIADLAGLLTERQDNAAVVVEPEVPHSSERFITEPVLSAIP